MKSWARTSGHWRANGVPAPRKGKHSPCLGYGPVFRKLKVPHILLLILMVGCASTIPRPPTSPHLPGELVEVPFPPPANRSDLVPPRPHPNSLWVDGEWRWQRTRWTWRPGAWVIPPPGATLAREETIRLGLKVLHAGSVFRLADGSALAPGELRTRRARPGNPLAGCPSAVAAPPRKVTE